MEMTVIPPALNSQGKRRRDWMVRVDMADGSFHFSTGFGSQVLAGEYLKNWNKE